MSDNTPKGDIEAVRPLTATQSRALSKLVANDANQVRTEIDEFADAQVVEATEHIKAEWAARSADSNAWEDKGRAIMSRFTSSRLRLIREAEAAGVVLRIPDVERYGDRLKATVTGMERAIKDETQRINNARAAAKSRLRRQELALERRVLEASITSQAQAILDTLPSARDLMVADAATFATRTVEA